MQITRQKSDTLRYSRKNMARKQNKTILYGRDTQNIHITIYFIIDFLEVLCDQVFADTSL